MFVNTKQQVPITRDDANIIYIRERMGFAQYQQAQDALIAVDLGSGVSDPKMRLGAYNMALMILNIVDWTGPAFAGVPCTAANIERLDPQEPLVQAVLEEIGTRNRPPAQEVPDPNLPMAPGTSPAGLRLSAAA